MFRHSPYFHTMSISPERCTTCSYKGLYAICLDSNESKKRKLIQMGYKRDFCEPSNILQPGIFSLKLKPCFVNTVIISYCFRLLRCFDRTTLKTSNQSYQILKKIHRSIKHLGQNATAMKTVLGYLVVSCFLVMFVFHSLKEKQLPAMKTSPQKRKIQSRM